MKIGIIDADLIGREKHRFPNLAWETVIDNFANGNNSKVDKGIIYDYYCLKKIRPSYDGAGANAVYEIDHIYAQTQLLPLWSASWCLSTFSIRFWRTFSSVR